MKKLFIIAIVSCNFLNAQSNLFPTIGNVGIGTVNPTSLLTIQAGHLNSNILLHSTGDGINESNQADLMLWASEPHLSYTGVGIGNNVKNWNAATSIGGISRISNSRGGSYIRLLDNSMNFNLVSNSGTDQSILTLKDNGNVGVGTENPTEKLEVVGRIKAKNLLATNDATSLTSFPSLLEWYENTHVLSAGFRMPDPSPNIPGAYRRGLNFYDMAFPTANDANAQNNDYLVFSIIDRNNKERLLFEGHKAGGASNGRASFNINNKLQENIFKLNDDGNNNVWIHMPKENSRIVIAGWGDYLPEHKLVVRGSSKIEGNILTDANIGIGTSNFTDGTDTYRLSVKGKIRAEEIKVYNTWADYVFNGDYRLLKLNEVEDFINKNGHLPNVPSAKQITENGLELGEMSKIQQEKIEELTLYLIQQNKEIEELKAQMKVLLEKK